MVLKKIHKSKEDKSSEYCVGKPASGGKIKPQFIVLANFHGVNIPIMANVKLPAI